MNAPLVSVVMPVYNTALYLREAIESIQQQTLTQWELIVVDDGSSDNSCEIVRKMAATDDRIELIELSENRGAAAARNVGVAHAISEIVAVMDSDDLMVPNRLQLQYNELIARPDLAVVGGGQRYLSTENRRKDMIPVLSHGAIQYAMATGNHPVCIGPTLCFRKKPFLQVGGYPEEMKAAHDFALFSKIANKYPVCNLPLILILYRIRQGSITQTIRSTQQNNLEAERLNNLKRWLPEYQNDSVMSTLSNLNKKTVPDGSMSLVEFRETHQRLVQLIETAYPNDKKELQQTVRKTQKNRFDLFLDHSLYNRFRKLVYIIQQQWRWPKSLLYQIMIHVFTIPIDRIRKERDE